MLVKRKQKICKNGSIKKCIIDKFLVHISKLSLFSLYCKIVILIILMIVLSGASNYVSADELIKTFSTYQSYEKIITLGSEYNRLSSIGKESKISKRPFIFRHLYNDFVYILHEPDFYEVVGGLSLAPSVFSSAFRSEEPELTESWGPSQLADNFFEYGDAIGNGTFPFVLSISSWGVGKIINNESMKSFGSDLFRTQTVNGILTIAMKGAINRQRPNGAPYSYPSGHTSSSFATAGVVYKHYGKTWGISAFVLAGYVGLSRLQENKHYLSDVIAGGILGSYVGFKISRQENKKSSLSIAPVKTGDGGGLLLTFKF